MRRCPANPGSVSRVEPHPRWRWLAPGLAFAVVLSRLLLLPDGPWEQDEAIFASATVDFDLAAHRPHPPGFPGYVALGWLMRWLVGDALLGLRILGALSSGALAWGLARVLSRRLAPGTAWAIAILHACLPVVWFHGGRAFSTTPACALAVWSVELWLERDASPRRSMMGWGLAALALTVRPHLAPLIAWLALVRLVPRSSDTVLACLRREAAGIGIALTIGALAYGWVVVDSGGWASFVRICQAHFRQHAKVLGNGPAFGDLGVVRGVGGEAWTAVWTGFGLAGLAAVGRGLGAERPAQQRDDGWWIAAWLAGACLIAATLVLRLHAPTFPRYSVLLVSTAIVPVGLAALWLQPLRSRWDGWHHAAPAAFTVLAAVHGASAWPVMRAAHQSPIPPVAALRAVPKTGGGVLLYSHGHSAFVRYFELQRGLERPLANTDQAGQRLGEGDVDYVGRSQGGRVLPGATVSIRDFDDFPRAAWDLSQRRYGWTQWAHNPVWLGEGAHGIEHGERNEAFAWLAGQATLRPPNGAARLELAVRVDDGFAPQVIEPVVEGSPAATVTLEAGLHRVSVSLEACVLERSGCEVVLGMPDARQIEGDGRTLSVRLLGAWVDGAGVTAVPQRVTPGQPGAVAAADMHIEGLYAPDRFVNDTRYGAWSGPHIEVRARAEAGTMGFELARPAKVDGPVVIRSGAGEWTFDVDTEPAWYQVDIEPIEGYATVTLEAPTFSPGKGDTRELGLIVLGIETRGRQPQPEAQ